MANIYINGRKLIEGRYMEFEWDDVDEADYSDPENHLP